MAFAKDGCLNPSLCVTLPTCWVPSPRSSGESISHCFSVGKDEFQEFYTLSPCFLCVQRLHIVLNKYVHIYSNNMHACIRCMHVCMCLYVCMYVYMYVYIYVCVCMYICVYICIYVCVRVCMYMCMCVHMYVCSCVCMCRAILRHNKTTVHILTPLSTLFYTSDGQQVFTLSYQSTIGILIKN